MECDRCCLNGSDAVCCVIAKLANDIVGLKKEIPILGKYVQKYECPYFMKKEEAE